MCSSKDVALVFCSLSPYDEMLLLSWNLEPYGCRIQSSVSEALEEAEQERSSFLVKRSRLESQQPILLLVYC